MGWLDLKICEFDAQLLPRYVERSTEKQYFKVTEIFYKNVPFTKDKTIVQKIHDDAIKEFRSKGSILVQIKHSPLDIENVCKQNP